MSALVSVLLAAAAASAQPAAQPGQDQENVVVTRRRADTRRILERCLARGCPPNQDIDATLGHAEVLFEEGEYEEAHRTITASIRRNRSHVRDYPEPVADLYRSHARVSSHMGRDDDVRRSTYQTLRALQEGIEREDHRHFTARVEVAEMLAKRGEFDAARRELARLADSARSAGRQDVVRLAEMRSLWIDYAAAPHGPARRRIVQLAEAQPSDSDGRIRTVGARILLARIYRREGEGRRADEIIASLGRLDSERRRLLHNPPYQLAVREAVADTDAGDAPESANVLNRLGLDTTDMWVDVGFWIEANGDVSDVQVLRAGRATGWASPLLASIRGRRYSPSIRNDRSYRLERYSMTAPAEITTGSRMVRRGANARIEYYDLTNYGPPQAD